MQLTERNMAQVDIPTVGKVDFSNPTDALMTILMAIIGIALAFGIFRTGQSVWNRIAQMTGPATQEVDIL